MEADDSRTDWTAVRGPIGIALSGGGLRAAAFGLGALQALDSELGALRGPRAAHYLAAVSGGSYTASAVTLFLHSDQFGEGVRPTGHVFAPGSSEATYLAANSDYLIRNGWPRFIGAIVLTILKGVFAASAVLLWPAVLIGFMGSLPWQVTGTLLATRAIALVGVSLWALALYVVVSGRPFKLISLWLWSIAVMALAPTMSAAAASVSPLRSPRWVAEHGAELLLLFVASVLAAAAWSFMRSTLLERSARSALREGVVQPTLRSIQVLILLSSAWIIVALRTDLSLGLFLLSFGVLSVYGYVAFHAAGDIVSPYHFYRDRLVRFFSVTSTATGPSPTCEPHEVMLSELKPSMEPSERTPELVICATANMTSPKRDCPRSGAVSFVMSPSSIELHHGPTGHHMPTETFEQYHLPADMNGRSEHALSLSAAVALSGAAVSPAMGNMTLKHLRTLFTIFNLRLGRWLPNISNTDLRDLHSSSNGAVKLRVDSGELLRETLGVHLASSPLVYVSDGGHYDNLGIVELLRRRCTLIVCVDASGDPVGVPRTLNESLKLAEAEIEATVEIDLSRFTRSANERRYLAHTSAVGRVRYSDGTKAHLVVVKIGLASTSSPEVQRLRDRWRRFPHHGTSNQFYTSERFNAYRALGYDTTTVAISSDEVGEVLREVAWRT